MSPTYIKLVLSNFIYILLCLSLIVTYHIYCIFIKSFILIGLINKKQVENIQNKIQNLNQNIMQIQNYVTFRE